MQHSDDSPCVACHYNEDLDLVLSEPTNNTIENDISCNVGYTSGAKQYIGTLATEPPPRDSSPEWDSSCDVSITSNDDYLSNYDTICDEYKGDNNQISEIIHDLYGKGKINDSVIYDTYEFNQTIPQYDGAVETTYLDGFESQDTEDDSGYYGYGFESDSMEDTTDYDSCYSNLGELVQPNEVIESNINFVTEVVGFGKQYISGASGYPPECDFDNGPYCSILDVKNNNGYINSWEEIESNTNVDINHIIGDTRGQVCSEGGTHKLCNIFGQSILLAQNQVGYDYYSIDNLNNNEYEVIPRDTIKWTIKIPVQLPNGTLAIVNMMADTGANVGCIDYDWAWEHWSDCIYKVGRQDVFNTPGGPVSPNLCCHFIIPTKSGKNLKAILYLIKNLPCKIIADLNMLLKLGYKFEAPENSNLRYYHQEEEDLDLHLDYHPKIHKVLALDHIPEAPQKILNYEDYVNIKNNQVQYITDDDHGTYAVHLNRDVGTCTSIKGGEKVLYDEFYGTTINENEDANNLTDEQRADHIVNEILDTKMVDCNTVKDEDSFLTMITTSKYYKPGFGKTIINNIMNDPNYFKIEGSNQQIENKVKLINKENHQLKNTVANITNQPMKIKHRKTKYGNGMFGTRNYGMRTRTLNIQLGARGSINLNAHRHINFIMMKQSFLATPEEVENAMKLDADKPLKINSIEYLKDYPRLYGPKFKGFYSKVKKLLDKYSDVFAKSTYARRTWTIPGVRLGIMEKYRKVTCYKSQYPLSMEQRRWMIYYTKLNIESGYWYPVTTALHCIPFTMVSKKNAKGVVTRMRPALDCRLVNTFCETFSIAMPTLRDFDERYAIQGLFTLGDIKNMYDCIPLDKRDRPWATVMTPIGLMQMRCLGYGWKNAPAIAQGLMNLMALQILFTLIYIDDIMMKHPEEMSGDEHVDHLESLLLYCREKNILLSPTKFYPFVSECTSFGFKRTMEGSSVSEDYKKKILSFSKPANVKELREFLGVIGYIKRYLYDSSIIEYWLNRLAVRTPERGKINWVKHPEAEVSFNQLLWLTKNAPILYNPNIYGKFCIKTDACNYGAGAVLYQQQKDKDGQLVWRIIDMMNKTVPQNLRHCHSMIHEAWAIVQTCQYWQFHLLRRPFIISTDNLPISKLFTPEFKALNDQTQRQLLRLRVAISMFNYEMRHVPGIKNELADGLSRYTVRLFAEDPLKKAKAMRILNWSDTNHKEMTQDERDELEYYQTRLTNEHRKQIKITEKDKQNNVSFIEKSNEINSFNNIVQLYKCLDKPTKMNEHDYNLITKQINKTWNKTMSFYSRSARYNERPRINSILNSSTNNVLQSSEYSFNDKPFNTLLKSLPQMKQSMSKISNQQLNQLTTDTRIAMQIMDERNRKRELAKYKYLTTKARYTKNKSKQKPQNMANPVKSRYLQQLDEFYHDPGDSDDQWHPPQNMPDLEEEFDEPLQVTTRSKSKQGKKKKKQQNNDNNNDNMDQDNINVKKVDYIDPDYDDITRSLHYRNEFMEMLYGYRHKIDFFDPNVMWTYQDADVAIQCTRYLLAVYEDEGVLDLDNPTVAQAVSDLKREEIDMYNNLINGRYIIDEEFDLLQIPMYDTLTDETHNCWVVPFVLRGKFMDHAHHNPNSHHYHWKQTYYNLCFAYQWNGMYSDVQNFCERCLLCHYVKGSVRHRAPMQIRQLSRPREHIMIDFIGSIFGKYYILAIIDYCTGWTMLIPCAQSNTQVVIDALMKQWIPIHGNFQYLDSDYGSYFNSTLFRAFCEANETNIQYTEPRSHRGLGKVERVIQLVQTVLQRFNIELGERLTNNKIQEKETSWEMIKAILPHIQIAINQRRPRFTTFSPNMLMFGTNLRDLTTLHHTKDELKRIFNAQEDKVKRSLNKRRSLTDQIPMSTEEEKKQKDFDYKYLERLLHHIQSMFDIFTEDWIDYTYLAKKSYDDRRRITANRINKNRKHYTEGKKVLYYVGDIQHANRKWRSKWTGPWTIKKVLNDSTIIIADMDSGNQKRVSIDRVKLFEKKGYMPYSELYGKGYEEYDKYQTELREQLYRLGTKPRMETEDKLLDFDQIRNRL